MSVERAIAEPRDERETHAREPRRAGLALGVLLVAAWALAVDGGFVQHRAVAGPIAIARAIARGVVNTTLLADLGATLARIAAGVLVGALLGLAIGVAVGAPRGRALEPSLDFLRAIPPLLVFPLLLLAFGYDERARVGAIAWATTLVVSMHVASGASRASVARARALRAMGAGLVHRVRWLHLYELAPFFLTGLRHAVGSAAVVATVTEMVVGAEHGLGTRALNAQIAYDAPDLYAVIVVTGAVGFALSRAILALSRRVAAPAS